MAFPLEIQASGAPARSFFWNGNPFRALLPIGMDFNALDEVENLGEVSVLLLADSGLRAD